jgi:hypothetical protein
MVQGEAEEAMTKGFMPDDGKPPTLADLASAVQGALHMKLRLKSPTDPDRAAIAEAEVRRFIVANAQGPDSPWSPACAALMRLPGEDRRAVARMMLGAIAPYAFGGLRSLRNVRNDDRRIREALRQRTLDGSAPGASWLTTTTIS